jgi:hypothetical protein
MLNPKTKCIQDNHMGLNLLYNPNFSYTLMVPVQYRFGYSGWLNKFFFYGR